MSTPLQTRFRQLDTLLDQSRPLWQLRPFEWLELPWPERPALRGALQALPAEEVAVLAGDDRARADWLRPYVENLDALIALSRTEPLAVAPAPVPARLGYHIPGRKWQQIRAFEAALPEGPLPYLEWCAGKGHLGRLLAHRRGRPVTSLEIDTALCRAGETLAGRLALDCRFVRLDALGDAAADQLRPEQHAVALHACGKLHLRLLEQASQRGTRALSLSPCCYHLVDGDRYRPLSRAGRQSRLRLDKQDLSLPLQELVTGGRRVARLRRRELAWRLGFDLLQRRVTGRDRYLPCPAAPRHLLSETFEGFCGWVAGYKGIALPAGLDYPHFLAAGETRAALMDRIDLVRHLFRRPLELWLVLDRALYLEERGYRVRLGTFCDRQLTPRNLLIQAERDG